MSFSAELRHELVSLPAAKPCCMAAELSALTACLASMSLRGQGRVQLVYETRSAGVLRRIFSLLKQRYAIKGVPSLTNLSRFGGVKLYQLRLTVEDSRTLLLGLAPDHRGGMQRLGLPSVPKRVVRRICCRRAWIRGAFLACGSIGDPRRGYRAEFVLDDAQRAEYLEKLLKLSGVESLRATRRGSEVVYIRQGDSLVTLLGLMGAGRAVMEIENIRAESSVRARTNRAANCDAGNLRKQVDAAQRQVEAITRISLARGLTSLPRELEELARLRLSHPDLKLKELGEMLAKPLSKAGVQHRIARIMQAAESIDQES